MKICELIISDIKSVNAIVEALCTNGYTVQTAVSWKQFPEKGIEAFHVAIFDKPPKGE